MTEAKQKLVIPFVTVGKPVLTEVAFYPMGNVNQILIVKIPQSLFVKKGFVLNQVIKLIPILTTKVTIEKNHENIIVETLHCNVSTKEK